MVNWDKMLAFETPRMIRIEDARIGCVNKIMQALFFFSIIMYPLINDPESFYQAVTPDIDLSWYASLGNLTDQQDKDAKRTFCNNLTRPDNAAGTVARAKETTYGNNKFDSDTSCTSSLDKPLTEAETFWFEYDHKCIDLSYEEMIFKGENQFFFTTKFDQTNSYNQRCDNTDCSALGTSTDYTFKRRNKHQCQCARKTSHFVTGVEAMDFSVSLFYKVAHSSFDISGSEWFTKSPPLVMLKQDGTPLKDGPDGHDIVFEQGQVSARYSTPRC